MTPRGSGNYALAPAHSFELPPNIQIERGFCRALGLVKTILMLTFRAVAPSIRLVRRWFLAGC